MAEGDSEDAWAQVAGKIIDIKDYTKKKELYLSQLLDSINGFAYPVKGLNVKQANAVLCQVCSTLSANDEVLISKCSHYVTNIVLRQEVVFSSEAQNSCLHLFLSSLTSATDHVASDVLYAIAAMARIHSKWKPEYMDTLIASSGVLFKFVPPSFSLQTCRIAVNCLHAIIKHVGVSDDAMRCLVGHLLSLLQDATAHSLDELQLCKFLLACHKALITVVPDLPRDALMATLPSMLAVLKVQMYYKLESAGQAGTPPSTGKRHSRQAKKKQKKSGGKTNALSSGSEQMSASSDSDVYHHGGDDIFDQQRSHRSHPGQYKMQSSDSEHSDTESASQWMRLQNAKVRQHACIGLASVFKHCGARTVFGYWSSFLPDTPAPPPPRVAPPTLLTLVTQDPLSHSRCAAIQVINTIFEGSGPLLAAADDKTPTSLHAFKAFSQTLGGIIKEVHCRLLLALKAERYSVTIVQLVKCLMTIVTNCPYHQLSGCYITKVITDMTRVSNHSNSDVHMACLKCFAAILSSHAPLAEVETWLSSGNDSEQSHGNKKESKESTNQKMAERTPVRPWVVSHCLKLFGNHDQPHIQHEAIQVMTVLLKNYSHLVHQYCEDVYDHVVIAMMDVKARYHLLKLLEELGRCLATHRQQIGLSKCTEMWEGLLAGPLSLCLRDSSLVVRSIALDVMATLGDDTLKQLNHSQCMMVLSMVLNMSKDPDPGVCSAAVRTLGVFVTYPSLSEDATFMVDSSQSIVAAVAIKNNLLVRIKAAWSLANLCDILLTLSEPLPEEIYKQLFQSSTNACLDTDKVKYNGVRALGNLFASVGAEQLKICNGLLQQALEAMAQCIAVGSSKFLPNMEMFANDMLILLMPVTTSQTRWNACYAARLVLQRKQVTSNNPKGLEVVISTLSTVIYECKNFKVRTKASLALCSLQRCCISSPAHLAGILVAVVKALQCSDSLTDFSEYKHSASLKQQLCKAFCYLTNLMVQEDIVEVNRALTPRLSVVRQYLGETLCSNSVPLTDASAQLSANNKSAVSDDLKAEIEGTSVVTLDFLTETVSKHLTTMLDGGISTEDEIFLKELLKLFDTMQYRKQESNLPLPSVI